jgi:hypothetical protein
MHGLSFTWVKLNRVGFLAPAKKPGLCISIRFCGIIVVKEE